MRIAYIIFIFTLIVTANAGSYSDVANGVKAHESGDFQEALDKFRKADLVEPESPIIQNNLGLSLYKLKDFEKAQEEFEKAYSTSEESIKKSDIQYNLGNSYFQSDSLARSIIHYQKALELNPNNENAKYNLELARAILKEFSEKQEQEQQQQEQQEQNQEEQNQEQQEQEEQNQQQQEQEKQNQEEQNQQQQEQQSQPGEMSEEEAERMLDAMNDDEEELQQEKMRQQSGSGQRSMKPW